jgi:hypothetical protein
MVNSQIDIENSNQISTITSTQFQSLDFVELDRNYFNSEVSLGLTSTQKGDDFYFN